MMVRSRVVRMVICTFVFYSLPPHNAGSAAPYPPKELTIRFEGGLAVEDFGEVISALSHEGFINLTVHIDKDGLTPASILSTTARLVGKAVSPALERYLCDINQHVCAIRDGKFVWTNQQAPPDVEAPSVTCLDIEKGKKELPPYAMCIPDITVSPYKTVISVLYNAKQEELKHIVVGRTGGCDVFDNQCQAIIRILNPSRDPKHDPFSQKFGGRLQVPVQAYRVTFPINSFDQFNGMLEIIYHVIGIRRNEGHLVKDSTNLLVTVPPPPARSQEAHFRQTTSTTSEPIREYLEPLRTMGYPYDSEQNFPFSTFVPVRVGLWDTRVDEEHCDFKSRNGLTFLDPADPMPLRTGDPSPPPRISTCATQRELFRTKFDHGTHLAGILGAQFNDKGIAGINPLVRLWAYEFSGQRVEDEGDPIFNMIKDLKVMKVINFSQALPTPKLESQLENLMLRTWKNRILFVAAAGNDGSRIDSGVVRCKVYPACWSSHPKEGSGILSVVALDPNGKSVLRDKGRPISNFGLAFDVAAIGVAKSTFHGNYFGEMWGTSVAAVYATGLASLIIAKDGFQSTITPQDLKKRIRFTSDFNPALDRLVRFGRINFDRALSFKTDVLRIKRGFCTPGQCEIVTAFDKGLREFIVSQGLFDGVPLPRPRPIEVANIRRIAATDDTLSSRYWVIFEEKGALKKISEAKFQPNQSFSYTDKSGLLRSVQLNQVEDYVACSFVKDCK